MAIDIVELTRAGSKTEPASKATPGTDELEPREDFRSDDLLAEIETHPETWTVKIVTAQLQKEFEKLGVQRVNKADLKTLNNPDVTPKPAATPLHNAAENGNEAEIDKLLQADADLNATDQHGHTPLHKAAKHGHKALVTKLLLKGADPTIQDHARYTPRNVAYVFGEDDIAKLLRQHENLIFDGRLKN